MAIRLYIDEDAMSRALIAGLRARGVDVTSALDEGRLGFSDEDQLEFAAAQGRVLCTNNTRDFFRIHTEWSRANRAHAGIIFIPQQRFGVGEQIRRLLRMIAAHSDKEMRGRVAFLTDW